MLSAFNSQCLLLSLDSCFHERTVSLSNLPVAFLMLNASPAATISFDPCTTLFCMRSHSCASHTCPGCFVAHTHVFSFATDDWCFTSRSLGPSRLVPDSELILTCALPPGRQHILIWFFDGPHIISHHHVGDLFVSAEGASIHIVAER